ncbi:hypothetical protein CDO52_00800 [Nocardiopsis gilva YIM 90087]|uniref:Uncharacterized protein n=1 Tax=Nocardiopsis gilva YIM 90087 TaxID=1235441 RepID=A0A223S096_9ACTN|nr:hypothetical protein [Nocardiopsis gilva]ASU81517.1 hypothetical protein CDO52_00800 [Nocardiopsis gilva YIM 90087]
MTECPGPCNRTWRQLRDTHADALDAWAAAAPEHRGDPPDPPEVEPVPGEPVWCRRCAGAIRHSLADLDNLSALIAAEADGHRGRGDDSDKVRRSKGTPSPSPAADLIDALYGDLTHWEAVYREAIGAGTRPERSRGATALTISISWLSVHLDGVLTWPWSVDMGLAVLRWQRRLQATAKARPPARRKPFPCPRCDRRTLIYEEDRDLIRCENPDCCRVLSIDEYDAHVTEQEGKMAS